MKITAFFRRHISILIVSVLVLASLACSLTAGETPITESPQVASATTIPARSEPVPPGEGGDLMAFTSGGDIYVMPVGGADFQPLTGSLIMMTLEGEQGVRLLTDNDGDLRWDPAWSPDGSQIAFVSESDNGDGYEIYIVEADGSNLRRLTHENHYNSSPAWSPDGSQIAFVDDITIYVMEADGSDIRRLTHVNWNGDPTWSPDGSQIAFVSDRDDGGYEIYVMDAADGNNVYRLTENDIWEKNLAWSPDGSRIAFASERDGSGNLYVMDADGSNVRHLTKDTDWVESPAWRPDRDRVVVAVAKAPTPAPTPTAPKPNPTFDCTTYTTADGLVGDYIEAITVAPDGVVWFGTREGASRFDGETWTTFTYEDGLLNYDGSLKIPGIESVPVYISSVAVATDGAVWFGGHGASRFDGQTWVTYDTIDRRTLSVESIAVAPDGVLWFGGFGVFRFDGETWTSYTTAEGIDDNIRVIAVSPDGTVWATGTEYGDSGPTERLYRFDGETWTVVDALESNRVTSIAVAPDGSVYFGIEHGGISHFDGTNWHTYTEKDGLAHDNVRSVAAAPDGVLWVGTVAGLARFDGESWDIYTTADGLPSDDITLITVAPDGALWITGLGHDGVSHCTSTVGAVQPVSTPASSNHPPQILDYATINTVKNNSLGEIVGVTTNMVILASDRDGDPLTYTWTASNGSITGDGQTGLWQRELTDDGRLKSGTATVIITDGRGGQAKHTFSDE